MSFVIRCALTIGLAAASPIVPASDTESAGVETGKAAYYSSAFKGGRTASAERYDPNKLVTAHKRHPFGTKLRVTNLKNHKSVVVRVIDRGPSATDRIVDVSRRAAKELGFLREGIAKVKVEVIK